MIVLSSVNSGKVLVFIQYQCSSGSCDCDPDTWDMIAISVVIIVIHCLRMWVLNDKLKNGFILSLLRSHLHCSQSVCCCISLSLNKTDYSCQPHSLDSFAWLIMKSPVPAQTQFLRCNTNISSDSAEAKLNSSNDYCSSLFLFFFFFWCAHKRKDLQVQEEHSSILLSLLKGELCSQLSQYSIPVAYEARARWKGGVPPHGDPTQTSAWQRPRPFHWDKTQARSVRYHYKWFLCLIGNSCCALLPAGRCWKSVRLRVKLKVGLDVSTHPAFSRLTSALINLYPLHPALATDCKKAWK